MNSKIGWDLPLRVAISISLQESSQLNNWFCSHFAVSRKDGPSWIRFLPRVTVDSTIFGFIDLSQPRSDNSSFDTLGYSNSEKSKNKFSFQLCLIVSVCACLERCGESRPGSNWQWMSAWVCLPCEIRSPFHRGG